MAVVVMVVATERGVSCWTTFQCSCGGWCRLRGGGGQCKIIIALHGIMNGLLFADLCVCISFCCREKWRERN